MYCCTYGTAVFLYSTTTGGASPRRADARLGSANARNYRGCRQIETVIRHSTAWHLLLFLQHLHQRLAYSYSAAVSADVPTRAVLLYRLPYLLIQCCCICSCVYSAAVSAAEPTVLLHGLMCLLLFAVICYVTCCLSVNSQCVYGYL